MAALDPNEPASFVHLEAIIDRLAPEWTDEPNVLGIVPALKVSGGTVDPEALIIGFHVREKVAPELLADRGYMPIPVEIEGIPTDVILARQPAHGSVDERATRSQMFDTLIGGIGVGNANLNYYGTLAMTLLAQSDGRLVGLTNEHVLVFDGEGHVGDEVQQPRFYLKNEVSLDSASCCPNGVLHYRGVDNPVVDAAASVFAATALAAVLSDQIDPHRRGQDATVPGPGERTVRESVSVLLDYPEIPLPGTPYKVGVNWTYERYTDQSVYDHSVSEQQRNPHVIDVQHLLTDKRTYTRGGTVTFLALLGPEEERKHCNNYFVTAAALSPSHRRAYKLILRPYDPPVGLAALTYGEAGHFLEERLVRHCFLYRHLEAGLQFTTPLTIEGIRYDPQHATARFVQDSEGQIAMQLPHQGMAITLPSPVQQVWLRLEVPDAEAVSVRAYYGDEEVAYEQHPSSDMPGEITITVEAARINGLDVSDRRGAALLRELCVTTRVAHACMYRGTVNLAPDEELGMWSTYVFAQTSNDVALGTDPTTAAQTIGALPVTHNFVSAGDTDNIAYGHMCNVDIASDGSFEVVTPRALT